MKRKSGDQQEGPDLEAATPRRHGPDDAEAGLHAALARERRRRLGLEALWDGAGIAALVVDAAGVLESFSPAVRALVSVEAADIGRPLRERPHRFVDVGLLDDAPEALRTGEPQRRELTADDGRVFLATTFTAGGDEDRPQRVALTFTDITEPKQAQAELAAQRHYAELVIDSVREPLLVLDAALRVQRANDAFYALFQASAADTLGKCIWELGDGRWDLPRLRERLERILPANDAFAGFEVEQDVPALGRRTMRLNARRVDHVNLILLAIRDVTEERAARARIERLALYDDLTGLANRTLLYDRLNQALLASRRSGEKVALLLIDLDGFKELNDSFGHAAGDEALRQVARRLLEVVRAGDTVARLGGDEFAVVLVDLPGIASLEAGGRRIMQAFAPRLAIDGQEVQLSVSSGIAVAPDDGAEADTLIRHADLALYRAKSGGRRQFRFYEPAMNTQAQERRQLERDLRRALDRAEFRLVYQPQCELRTGRVVAVEALLRWDHPTRGELAPAAFMLVAETTGQIRPIGAWVLDAACAQARRWRDDGLGVAVAVNVSAAQLRFDRIDELAAQALATHGLDVASLELEIAERLLAEPARSGAAPLLEAAKRQGFHLVVDDFGRGPTELRGLTGLPGKKLKIDRSLLAGLDTEPASASLLEALIKLGHGLGREVLVEGVETEAQRTRLLEIGCPLAQGFLFARPGPPDAVQSLLAAGAGPRPA